MDVGDIQTKINTKLYQLQKLMDLDAKNTNAPQSMSLLIQSTVTFDKDSILKAKYILGQLEEWVHELVQQTGYQGCLADL